MKNIPIPVVSVVKALVSFVEVVMPEEKAMCVIFNLYRKTLANSVCKLKMKLWFDIIN